MNEKWYVLTYRDYDFEDKGRTVRGRTLHCYRNTGDSSWAGIEYAKFSVPYGSDAYNTQVSPGKEYEVTFNRYGKITQLVLVK